MSETQRRAMRNRLLNYIDFLSKEVEPLIETEGNPSDSAGLDQEDDTPTQTPEEDRMHSEPIHVWCDGCCGNQETNPASSQECNDQEDSSLPGSSRPSNCDGASDGGDCDPGQEVNEALANHYETVQNHANQRLSTAVPLEVPATQPGSHYTASKQTSSNDTIRTRTHCQKCNKMNNSVAMEPGEHDNNKDDDDDSSDRKNAPNTSAPSSSSSSPSSSSPSSSSPSSSSPSPNAITTISAYPFFPSYTSPSSPRSVIPDSPSSISQASSFSGTSTRTSIRATPQEVERFKNHVQTVREMINALRNHSKLRDAELNKQVMERFEKIREREEEAANPKENRNPWAEFAWARDKHVAAGWSGEAEGGSIGSSSSCSSSMGWGDDDITSPGEDGGWEVHEDGNDTIKVSVDSWSYRSEDQPPDSKEKKKRLTKLAEGGYTPDDLTWEEMRQQAAIDERYGYLMDGDRRRTSRL